MEIEAEEWPYNLSALNSRYFSIKMQVVILQDRATKKNDKTRSPNPSEYELCLNFQSKLFMNIYDVAI